jgi:hypothetical protein
MKLELFPTFAMEKLKTENMKTQTWWRTVTRPVKDVSCYYILGQYMNITHNLLYKTWAYWPGVYIDILYIKC